MRGGRMSMASRRLARRCIDAAALQRGRAVGSLRVRADVRHDGPGAQASRVLLGERAGTVAAYWWTGQPNFGDMLAPAILAWLTGATPQRVNAATRGKVLAVGSNAHRITRGDVVWGAGVLYDRVADVEPATRVLAVRGPLTSERLRGAEPRAIGDPAILLPLLHPPQAKRFAVGIVPHFSDVDLAQVGDPSALVIDPRQRWRDVVDQITSCHRIVSSSLHGLIVAEAYGIPASWVSIGGEVRGAYLKFNDYYLGSGRGWREPTPWRAGLRAALEAAAPAASLDPAGLVDAWRSDGLPVARQADAM